jgi:penicillin-binding protein 2
MAVAGQQPERSRFRVATLGLVILSLFSALIARLWFLQVLAGDEYKTAAQGQAVRLVPIEPSRGRILDRKGETLVRNRPSLVVSVRKDELRNPNETLDRLSALLGMPREKIQERLDDKRIPPYTAVPIKEDVPEESIVYMMEHNDLFPGVIGEMRPVRVYPHGSLAAHILGYTGEITQEQLTQEHYKGFKAGASVGRNGIEYAYERALHGVPGAVKLQVDATGAVRGEPLGRQEAVTGYDIVSTLDARVQQIVEDSLATGLERARTIFHEDSAKHYLAPAGGAVVLDPNNGEIIASASFPTFNPEAFVGGISQGEFDELAKNPANPLLDRVTQAAFPPGSTFKVVTAAAALQEGVANGGDRYDCPPSFRFADRTFRNWRPSHSGRITLSQALVESCDTVFYDFAAKFWQRFRKDGVEVLQDYARKFGFGAKTGIEVPFEKAGRVADEEWLHEMNARYPKAFPFKVWLPGYTINMGIGQGDLLVTPIQLATAYGAIANGGTLWQPHVGMRIQEGSQVVTIPSKETGRIPLTAASLDPIRRGLENVVRPGGTAVGAFAGFPLDRFPIAAKTGTAEILPKQPFAWFAAYGPAPSPKYVVVVMVEEGGHGGEVAAPIARRIFEGLFDLPLSEIRPAAKTD